MPKNRTPSPAIAHWSKDFVEHLRSVHFALIAVSVGLVLILSRVNSPALSEIRQIMQLKKEWPPGWLYYAGTSRHDGKNELLIDRSRSRGLFLRRKDLKQFVGYVSGAKGRRMLLFTLPEQNWHLEYLEGSDWSLSYFPVTLSSFREWWNELQTSHRIYFPYFLCGKGDIYQYGMHGLKGDSSWRLVGQVVLQPASTVQTPTAKSLRVAKTFRLGLGRLR